MYDGTQSDNIRDSYKKGRSKVRNFGEYKGSKNGRSKLTEEKIVEIRRRLDSGEANMNQIANELKVSR